MTSDDLPARVAALETQMSELSARVGRSEQDAAAATVLAGAADRDVSQAAGELRDFRMRPPRVSTPSGKTSSTCAPTSIEASRKCAANSTHPQPARNTSPTSFKRSSTATKPKPTQGI